MDKTLQVKVSMMVDLNEASTDIAKQINKLTVPDIPVKINILPISDGDLKKIDFSSITNKLKDAFNINEELMGDVKNITTTISDILSIGISESKLQGFVQLSNALKDLTSSFSIDDATFNKFKVMNDMLTQFNRLSKDAQKVLTKQTNSAITEKTESSIQSSLNKNNAEYKKQQDALVNEYKAIYRAQEKIQKSLHKIKDENVYNELISQADKYEDKLKSIKESITSVSHKDKISLFETEKLASQSIEIAKAFDTMKDKAKSFELKIKDLENSEYVDRQKLSEAKSHLIDISNIEFVTTIGELTKVNSKLIKVSDTIDSIKSKSATEIFQSDKFIKLDEIDRAIDKIKNDFKDVLDERTIDQWKQSARRLSQIMDKDSFSQGAKELTSQLKRARHELDSLADTSSRYNFFEDLYDNMRTYQLGDLIVDGIQDALSNAKDIVIDLDDAMSNVKKVSIPVDVSSIDKLDDIKNKAIQISKEVGMASTDVLNSIADTIQTSGYRMEEAMEIAKQTMMLANVGDISSEQATEGVVSMLAGFNLNPLREIQVEVNGVTKSTNELTDSMDKVNYVGNNFAISTEGILNAMQSGATVLHSYGVSMNDTIAMITGANKTLQDPNVVKIFDVSGRNTCYYYWAKSVD